MKYELVSVIALALLVPDVRSIEGWKPVLGSSHDSSIYGSDIPLEKTITYHGNFGGGSGGAGAKFLGGGGSLYGHHHLSAAPPPLPLAPSELAHEDQCGLYKVGFTQDLYFQYIQYKHEMPEMKEFTLCMWSKFTNHSNDHPLFSYAVDGQPRAILGWISNTDRSSYYSMSIHGHTFFRLNYPIRLNRWYHSCHSWNGRTGEWQLWINAERVGRGFHNRLVGHKIPAGGVFITGQEQRQLGGGFLEGDGAPKGSGGMLGEVTMVQLYKVALTAGKAHRDHKHHHVHKFLHEGVTTTSTTPRPPQRPPIPAHPLLTGGQINPNLNLNFAGGQPGQTPPPQPQIVPGQFNGQQLNSQYLNGQFLGRLVSEQLLSSQQVQGQQQPLNGGLTNAIVPASTGVERPFILPQTAGFGVNQFQNSVGNSQLVNPANVQFIDSAQLGEHQIFKREHKQKETTNERSKRESLPKSKTAEEDTEILKASETKHTKRGIFVAGGTLFEDSGLTGGVFDQSASSPFLLDGLAGIGQNQPVLEQQKSSDEREPAEAEVQAVMNICTGCDEEPFAKALVFGWRTVPKKLYSGAFYVPAVPQCKAF